MELTTLALALVFGLGLLGADSVMHAGSVEVEVAIAPKVENISVDEQTLASRFKDVFDEITSTASVVHPPEIRSRVDQGLGMALFEAVHAQNIAFALQREMGFNPDTVRFALFVENGALQALVAGRSHLVGNFSQVMALNPGESLMSFVRRCALWGGSQLAPIRPRSTSCSSTPPTRTSPMLWRWWGTPRRCCRRPQRASTAPCSTICSASSRCSATIRKPPARRSMTQSRRIPPMRCRSSTPPSPISNSTRTRRPPIAWRL